ncbi:MAG: NusG domain II-containing protein [Ruminococcus sp.]|nr:NusG domain II-containing protein [Ruminococcus sp.]
MKNSERKYFKPLDIAIVAFVLIIAVMAFTSQFNTKDTELSCVVRVNGEVEHTIALKNLETATLVDIDCEYPLSVYVSKDGVYVAFSSCPDKLCEHTGVITRASQSIVCLPAKVSVTLESNDKTLDAVVG